METTTEHLQARRGGRPHVGQSAIAAQNTIAALGDVKEVRLAFGLHAEVPLPADAFEVLMTALDQFAHGNRVKIVPVDTEMTTQQAADLLQVSRPYLVGLLNAGKIPCRKVGTKRRLLAADVLAYKAKDDQRRRKLLDELAAESQRLGLE